jgi:hypothetical protein
MSADRITGLIYSRTHLLYIGFVRLTNKEEYQYAFLQQNTAVITHD